MKYCSYVNDVSHKNCFHYINYHIFTVATIKAKFYVAKTYVTYLNKFLQHEILCVFRKMNL